MAAAAREVVECHRLLAEAKDNVVGALLRDAPNFVEWDHYPADDICDAESHAQYYYHAHPPADRSWTEHGHFHTFMRPAGMPDGVAALDLPDLSQTAPEDRLCHLVAISMDAFGLPIRLFTTNRWVTGDTWYAAKDAIRMVERFSMDPARQPSVVNRWITGMVCLFEPQIQGLLRERDRRVAAWRATRPDGSAFEDRELEVISSTPISLPDHIAALDDALTARGLGRRDSE